MQAILLAAGFGTRLRPYTLIRPKPLFPVLNRPLLHRLLDMLYKSGCTRIVVNAHHLAGQIRHSLAEYPDVVLQVEPEILGTGGSLRLAKEKLADGPILVMNGDIVHTVDVASLYDHHVRSGNEVTLAMHDYSRFNTVGVEDDRVVSFTPRQDVQQLAFTGIHVVNPEIVARIPGPGFFHIIDLYQELALQGRIGLLRVDGAFWRDIGTPEDYLQLHRELLETQTRLDIDPVGQKKDGWLVDEGVDLEKDVRLQDWGCLGRGVRVGNSTTLSRCVVWDQAEIPSGSRIIDAIVTGAGNV